MAQVTHHTAQHFASGPLGVLTSPHLQTLQAVGYTDTKLGAVLRCFWQIMLNANVIRS